MSPSLAAWCRDPFAQLELGDKLKSTDQRELGDALDSGDHWKLGDKYMLGGSSRVDGVCSSGAVGRCSPERFVRALASSKNA